MAFGAKRGEAIIKVAVGDGAIMTAPIDLEWHLRYGDPMLVRMQAAEAIASYDYLIRECSQDEALRRLKALREARHAVKEE
jgi:hypothetical protein